MRVEESKLKAAIYCRLSKEDMEKMGESESIQNQKLILIEYAQKQEWEIEGIYIDEDYSGLYDDRPQFKKMIQKAEKRSFDIILCKTQSRFSRRIETIERYFHQDFMKWGIRFISIADGIDTMAQEGKKARQINSLINEWYCEDLSENVKAALTAKKRAGQYLGHWCVYGYQLDPNNHHHMVPDPIAAEVVRKIYSLYLKGFGINRIAEELTKQGYLTPTAYKQRKGQRYFNPARPKYSASYGIWSQNTVRKILKDETYLGHLIQGKERKLSYKSKKIVKQPKEEWIIVKNNHEPILEQDIFDRVQELAGRRGSCINGIKQKPHIFASKIFCANCHSIMVKGYGKNKTIYLRCGLALKTKGKECSLHTIRMELLTELVEKKIQGFLIDFLKKEENKTELKKELQKDKAWEEGQNQAKEKREKWEQEKEKITKGFLALYLDKVNGILSDLEFSILKQSFQDKREILELEKEQIDREQKKLEQKWEQRKKKFFFEEWVQRFQLTHETVAFFLERIEVEEKKEDGEQRIQLFWRF